MAEVKIFFICTIQKRLESPDDARGDILQLQGRPTRIHLVDIPEDQIVNGIPSSTVLWQAEGMFLERQDDFYPDHHVIAWEARNQDSKGQLLSQFQLLLPTHEL